MFSKINQSYSSCRSGRILIHQSKAGSPSVTKRALDEVNKWLTVTELVTGFQKWSRENMSYYFRIKNDSSNHNIQELSLDLISQGQKRNGSCANCFCHLTLCIFYRLLSSCTLYLKYIGRKQRSYNFIMNSGGKVTSVPLKDTLKHYALHFIAGKVVSVHITCTADLYVFLRSSVTQWLLAAKVPEKSSLLPGIWYIRGLKAQVSWLESKLWPSLQYCYIVCHSPLANTAVI